MRRALVLVAFFACHSPSPSPSPLPSPSPSPSPSRSPSPSPSPSASASAAPAAKPSLSADATAEIAWRVAGGYDTRERIVDLVSTKSGASRELVGDVVDRKLAEHARAQATWKTSTDCDKLDAAFAALEKEGILVRPHFETSQDVADPLLQDEAKRLRASGKKVRGWAYWNESVTKQAVEEGTLMIIYGTPGAADASWNAVAAAIETRLKAAGLKAEWPYRNAAYPIQVSGLDWKKRR